MWAATCAHAADFCQNFTEKRKLDKFCGVDFTDLFITEDLFQDVQNWLGRWLVH